MHRSLDPTTLFRALVAVDDERHATSTPPEARLRRALAGLQAPDAATPEPSHDLAAQLRRSQHAIASHAHTLRAAVAALAAEGRRYAATPEGRRLQAALIDTPLARRGRAVWEALSMQQFDAPVDGSPSAHIAALLRAVRHPELEALLAALFVPAPEAAP